MKITKALNFTLAASILLTGCSAVQQRNEIYDVSKKDMDTINNKKDSLRVADEISSSPVREIDAVWLGSKTVKVSRDALLPDIFQKTISFQFSDEPTLTELADRLSKIIKMPVRVTSDALAVQAASTNHSLADDSGVQLPTPHGAIGPMNAIGGGRFGGMPISAAPIKSLDKRFILDLSSPYGGTLQNLLDQVAARYDVGWDYKQGGITISRIVTRTYQVASLIDTNETRSAVTKSGETSTDSKGGSSSESASQVSTSSSNSDVNTTVQSKIDVLADIKRSVESALTPKEGKYSISGFGVLTVTDTREVQEKIQDIIDAENRAIGRQVRVRFVMLEVEASSKNDTGFDISGAIAKASDKWNISFATPKGMLGGGDSSAGQIGILRDGSNTSTATFLKALSEVGRVNMRRDESYTLMNNRPLAIAHVDNFIYPARSTAGFTSDGAAGSGTAGVEPGQLTTGNFLNLRASVLPNGSVIVNLSLDTSRRGKTETYESNGTVLQYPQSSGGIYQTYASIPNGQTGVIAAIDTSSYEANDRSIDANVSPFLGGGIYNNKSNKRILILITPYVIEGAT